MFFLGFLGGVFPTLCAFGDGFRIDFGHPGPLKINQKCVTIIISKLWTPSGRGLFPDLLLEWGPGERF